MAGHISYAVWNMAYDSPRNIYMSVLPKQGKARESLADKIVEGVSCRSHNAGGASVTEAPLHAHFFAKGRASAQSHRQVGHLNGGLCRCSLAFEYAQHGVCAPAF